MQPKPFCAAVNKSPTSYLLLVMELSATPGNRTNCEEPTFRAGSDEVNLCRIPGSRQHEFPTRLKMTKPQGTSCVSTLSIMLFDKSSTCSCSWQSGRHVRNTPGRVVCVPATATIHSKERTIGPLCSTNTRKRQRKTICNAFRLRLFDIC